MNATSTPPRPRRLAGLDGLRAIAVALVVVYHLFPDSPLRSGFVGVDVFFVISGFLITTLLLNEDDATGRIRLGAFWQRRARRLLPALALLVTVCSTAAWMIGGDVLVRMGAQIFGAATFSYNWVSVAGGDDYFGGTAPELFRNLWSLAVEEQFYVLWPLVLPLLLLIRASWVRALVALVAAGGSAAWMTVLVLGDGDATRAYFGTDSHSFGILLGIALAFGMRRVLRSATPSRAAGPLTLVIGAVAVAGLVGVSLVDSESFGIAFPAVMVAASILTAAAISAGVRSGSWFGRAIDVQPLVWIGDRSYGIYLWHWPLLVLLMAWLGHGSPADGVPLPIGLATLAATLIMAELSYRLVETPVRRYGFRGSLALLWRRVAGSAASRFGALAGVAAWVIVIGGAGAAIAAAPQVTSAQSVVQAGQDALDAAAESDAGTDTDIPSEPGAGTSGTATPTPTRPEQPAHIGAPPPPPSATPTPVPGAQVTAVGDSVMLASAKALLQAFPGIDVDAKVSRSVWAAPGILKKLERAGKLRPVVVLAIGTNGPVDEKPLGEIMDIVGPDRHVVFVNAYAPRSWIKGVNRDLAEFVKTRPNASIADWSGAITDHVDLLAGDRIHPAGAGGRLFAATVRDAVQEVERLRTSREYSVALKAYREEYGLPDNMK